MPLEVFTLLWHFNGSMAGCAWSIHESGHMIFIEQTLITEMVAFKLNSNPLPIHTLTHYYYPAISWLEPRYKSVQRSFRFSGLEPEDQTADQTNSYPMYPYSTLWDKIPYMHSIGRSYFQMPSACRVHPSAPEFTIPISVVFWMWDREMEMYRLHCMCVCTWTMSALRG